jgi:RecJ-like exonuclease
MSSSKSLNLEIGEIRCDDCNGTGYIKINENERKCYKCKGTGKLNWIENVFGKSATTLEADIGIIDHGDKNKKGSISWCIKELEDGGIVELKPGIYDLSRSRPIEINKDVSFRGKDTNLTHGTIISTDSAHPLIFTSDSNNVSVSYCTFSHSN